MAKKPSKIIIEGITEAGQKFRPSDWAERVSDNLASFKQRRIVYSPMLQPMLKDGNKCVALDPALKESNPELYESILSFAKTNSLKVCSDDSNDANALPPTTPKDSDESK
jgi:hypothetical protein